MIKIYSRSDKEKLLHILFKKKDFNKRQDLINPSEFIQVASLVLKKAQTFIPHKHIFKKASLDRDIIAQESWVVIRGKVKVDYYDTDDSFLDAFILDEGDCTVTLYGGHNYTSLTSDTLVYEFKTGPYDGQIKDKISIKC